MINSAINLPAIPSIEALLFPNLTLSFPSALNNPNAFPASFAANSAFSLSLIAPGLGPFASVPGRADEDDLEEGVGVALVEGGERSALNPDLARSARVAREVLMIADACFERSSTVRICSGTSSLGVAAAFGTVLGREEEVEGMGLFGTAERAEDIAERGAARRVAVLEVALSGSRVVSSMERFVRDVARSMFDEEEGEAFRVVLVVREGTDLVLDGAGGGLVAAGILACFVMELSRVEARNELLARCLSLSPPTSPLQTRSTLQNIKVHHSPSIERPSASRREIESLVPSPLRNGSPDASFHLFPLFGGRQIDHIPLLSSSAPVSDSPSSRLCSPRRIRY